LLDVTIGDTTAQKQVDFKIERTQTERCPVQSIRFCFETRKGTHRWRIKCSPSLFLPFQTRDWLFDCDLIDVLGGPHVDPCKFATFFFRQPPILALTTKLPENVM